MDQKQSLTPEQVDLVIGSVYHELGDIDRSILFITDELAKPLRLRLSGEGDEELKEQQDILMLRHFQLSALLEVLDPPAGPLEEAKF